MVKEIFDNIIQPFEIIADELKKIFEFEMVILESVINTIEVRLILLPAMDKFPCMLNCSDCLVIITV